LTFLPTLLARMFQDVVVQRIGPGAWRIVYAVRMRPRD
jgi:hypothetical protein